MGIQLFETSAKENKNVEEVRIQVINFDKLKFFKSSLIKTMLFL
jgi:hypothetical protein